jgi:hypothetical protein
MKISFVTASEAKQSRAVPLTPGLLRLKASNDDQFFPGAQRRSDPDGGLDCFALAGSP